MSAAAQAISVQISIPSAVRRMIANMPSNVVIKNVWQVRPKEDPTGYSPGEGMAINQKVRDILACHAN